MIKKVYILFLLFSFANVSFAQTILYQDFESAGDNWNYTLNPATYSVGGDIWETRNALSSITPSSGTVFWGMQDLNNSNGGGPFEHTITFNAVNVSTYTGVTITFDYHTIGYDAGDYVRYEIFEDGISQGIVNLNGNTNAWTTTTYNVPNAVNSVYLVLIANQNGGSDYAGWDNIIIAGTSTVPCVTAAEPTANATNLTFPNTTCNSIDLNWTNGNGTNRIVVASTSPIIGTPTDQIAYNANTVFGSGATIAAGEFVIFNGNGTNVTVTGLSNSTTYYFAIFEYNGAIANCEENYFTTGILTGNETTSLAPEPTISPSILTFPDTTCYSIDLSWTTGNGANTIIFASTSPIAGIPSDQTAYTANLVFGNGSTIAAGEFAIYNGNGTSTTVTGLSQSTTYYFLIVEYNGVTANCEENYLTSSTLTGNFTTPICPPSNCPEITGILVDACNAGEGINEFFTFQNSNSNLEIDSLTANFPSGGSFCNSGCGAQNWVTNPSYTSQLNTTAACPGLFVEANPIPANAEVIVFTGKAPTYNFDFTGLCGTGPYYVVYANNTSTSGRFGNFGACATRTLTVDFGASCSDTAAYDRCLLSNTDGDYIAYDAAGNPTYSNDGCTPVAILPITLLYFKGNSINNNSNLLEWATTAEINNDYFTIERSKDAVNFTTIATVIGAGNSNIQLNYQLIDDNPLNGINYYRLKQTDFNGDYKYANTIAIENNSNYNLVINNYTLTVITKSTNPTDKIEIYDAIGQLIYSSSISNNVSINIQNFKQGIYIIKVGNSTNFNIQKMKF